MIQELSKMPPESQRSLYYHFMNDLGLFHTHIKNTERQSQLLPRGRFFGVTLEKQNVHKSIQQLCRSFVRHHLLTEAQKTACQRKWLHLLLFCKTGRDISGLFDTIVGSLIKIAERNYPGLEACFRDNLPPYGYLNLDQVREGFALATNRVELFATYDARNLISAEHAETLCAGVVQRYFAADRDDEKDAMLNHILEVPYVFDVRQMSHLGYRRKITETICDLVMDHVRENLSRSSIERLGL